MQRERQVKMNTPLEINLKDHKKVISSLFIRERCLNLSPCTQLLGPSWQAAPVERGDGDKSQINDLALKRHHTLTTGA